VGVGCCGIAVLAITTRQGGMLAGGMLMGNELLLVGVQFDEGSMVLLGAGWSGVAAAMDGMLECEKAVDLGVRSRAGGAVCKSGAAGCRCMESLCPWYGIISGGCSVMGEGICIGLLCFYGCTVFTGIGDCCIEVVVGVFGCLWPMCQLVQSRMLCCCRASTTTVLYAKCKGTIAYDWRERGTIVIRGVPC